MGRIIRLTATIKSICAGSLSDSAAFGVSVKNAISEAKLIVISIMSFCFVGLKNALTDIGIHFFGYLNRYVAMSALTVSIH